jgi:hypothetical protein
VTGLAFIGQLGIRGADDTQLWTALSLVAIAGFVIWLVFFSGNGDFKSFIQDLKGEPKTEKKEPFPVPVFDRSKIEVPRAPKPERKPLVYKRTADEIDLKLDTWAKDLRQSLREVRAESQWLVEKYKDVPLKRPKPETPTKKKAVESKAKAKPVAKAKSPTKAKAVTTKKTTTKPKTIKKASKPKPAKGKK